MLRLMILTILYFLFLFIVNGVRVSLKNRKPVSHIKSAASFRFFDKRHTKLFEEKKNEESSEELVEEYIHPEVHISSLITDYRKSVSVPLGFNFQIPNQHSGSIVSKINNDQNNRSMDFKSEYLLNNADDNDADVRIEDDFKIDYFPSSKRKRDVDALLDHKFRSSRVRRMKDNDSHHTTPGKKLFSEEIGSEIAENASKKIAATEKKNQNLSSKIIFKSSDFDNVSIDDNPWPIVPGPISCDLDFQIRPSFVAKLGEFDYLVSVQLQQNPEQLSDHSCTGVIYNPRFIIIAPHCLTDNYGLTVTSTDDLCTIDEMIEVDYVIEHESYDPELRKNDIALIKLKSGIHKRAAVFAQNYGNLDSIFYAVGFGEVMWKSFPDKVSKLLQKVPVRRYSNKLKEAPGTLHVTTSYMDMTGAFRGDFGGALVNPRGELVGLKSKLVRKLPGYEVYTRVQAYLPWIKSMVSLHGSW